MAFCISESSPNLRTFVVGRHIQPTLSITTVVAKGRNVHLDDMIALRTPVTSSRRVGMTLSGAAVEVFAFTGIV
jgi:hypothetical protein